MSDESSKNYSSPTMVKRLTIDLTAEEMKALNVLAKKKDLSHAAILRQGLRLYQLADAHWAKGGKLFFQKAHLKEKAAKRLRRPNESE